MDFRSRNPNRSLTSNFEYVCAISGMQIEDWFNYKNFLFLFVIGHFTSVKIAANTQHNLFIYLAGNFFISKIDSLNVFRLTWMSFAEWKVTLNFKKYPNLPQNKNNKIKIDRVLYIKIYQNRSYRSENEVKRITTLHRQLLFSSAYAVDRTNRMAYRCQLMEHTFNSGPNTYSAYNSNVSKWEKKYWNAET